MFDVALSRMPMTRTTVQISKITTAGRFIQPGFSEAKGSLLRTSGNRQPMMSSVNLLKYFDHDDATVAALIAYSRIKSQPMIQASNSPSVA